MAFASNGFLTLARTSIGETDALFSGRLDTEHIIELRLRGRTASDDVAPAQTIFSAFTADTIAPWLGLRGRANSDLDPRA